MKQRLLTMTLATAVVTTGVLSPSAVAEPRRVTGGAGIAVITSRTVERVEGLGSVWQVKDPSKLVGLVLTVSVPKSTGAIACADLVLAYRRNGQEDRSRCQGLGVIGDANQALWLLGHDAILHPEGTDGAPTKILVLFPLETGVDNVALAWARPVLRGIAVRPARGVAAH